MFACLSMQARHPRSLSLRLCAFALKRISRLRVKFVSIFSKLFGFFLHALLQRLFLGDALFGGVFADVFGDLHRAEMRTAHRAEVRGSG
jgi:hypothetical protein